MHPDLAQIGMAISALGFATIAILHGWWREPTDHLTNALSLGWTALTSLFPKEPQA